MGALARDVEEARRLLKECCEYIPDDELMTEPEVIEEPVAFYSWGGS